MEIVKISNIMKVESVLPDGIAMIKSDSKNIIPDLFFLKDKELINISLFEKKQIIEVSVENVEKLGKDKINKERIVLYAVVNQLCSGGFHTKYYDEDKGRWHREFFFAEKGLITIPKLRVGNPFEIGDFVKIVIKKN